MTRIIMDDLTKEMKVSQDDFDPAAVAELLGYLFDNNEKSRYNLWQVTEILYGISMTPLETENPFPSYQPDSTQLLSADVREEN